MQPIKKAIETMTARQRVQRTFAYEKTDRVTIGYLSNDAAHKRLCEAMGVGSDPYELLQALGVDYQMAKPRYIGPQLFPDIPDRWVNPETGFVKKYIQTEYGVAMDYCDFPLLGADDEAIYNYPAPNPDHYDYDETDRMIEMLLGKGFAVHVGDPALGDILNSNGVLLGFEDALVNMATGHEATLHMVDKRLGSQLAVTERVLERNKGKIDFMWVGEDMGTQRAPLISMDMYREFLKSRHQKFIDLAHVYGIPIIMHTCGYSSWAYEELITMGMDGVDTLQPEVTNMSPRYLQDQFGGRLNFRGCISTAGPLAYGTPKEVEQVCRDTLAIMMEKGGYHFAPTHKLQNNTPAENTIAMYQAAHTYGCYSK